MELNAKTTPVGFEPTRGDPIGLAGRRLNRSAKVSCERLCASEVTVHLGDLWNAGRPETKATLVGFEPASCERTCASKKFAQWEDLWNAGRSGAKATPVGFEPTRGDPMGLAGRRLNRSAKVSL